MSVAVARRGDQDMIAVLCSRIRRGTGGNMDFTFLGTTAAVFTVRDGGVPQLHKVFDVTPDGLELFWGFKADANADAALVSVGRVSADVLTQLRRYFSREAPGITGDPLAGLVDWHPRCPLGVWVDNGTVAVRSVTVQQLTPPVLPPQ